MLGIQATGIEWLRHVQVTETDVLRLYHGLNNSLYTIPRHKVVRRQHYQYDIVTEVIMTGNKAERYFTFEKLIHKYKALEFDN